VRLRGPEQKGSLLGPQGATAIYGPQKGAGEEELKNLEQFLSHLVGIAKADDLALAPGAGAAGGLGFGLMYFTDAELHSGFELVAEALQLKERISQADLVITGEGALDAQSLAGKGPVGIAKLAKECHTPAMAIAGNITEEITESQFFQTTSSISSYGLSLEESMSRAAELVTKLTLRMIENKSA